MSQSNPILNREVEDLLDIVRIQMKGRNIPKEVWITIDSLIFHLKDKIVISKTDREVLKKVYIILSNVNTSHVKTKNITLHHLNNLINNIVEDKSERVKKEQRQVCNRLVKRCLEWDRVCISSIPKDIMEELDRLLTIEDVLSLIEDIEENKKEISIDKEIKDILDSIDVFNYKSLWDKVDELRDRVKVLEEVKEGGIEDKSKEVGISSLGEVSGSLYACVLEGGGDVPIFPFTTEMKNKYLFILYKLLFYKQSSKYITNTYSNIDTLASKIAGLLIHIHYSLEKNVPITRRFIEHRGYEHLTSAEMYTINLEEDEKYEQWFSLSILEGLGFVEVKEHSIKNNTSRELTLTPKGQAIVGVLGTFHKRITYNVITLGPGDLSVEYKDYQYYINEKGFIPSRELIDKVIQIYGSRTFSVKEYLIGMREEYPICALSHEEYEELFEENYIELCINGIPDIDVLCKFDRDIRAITSGIAIDKTLLKKGVVSIDNVFTLSYTGRLFQRQGVQNISRESKAIYHRDRFNYDISNSQLCILHQLLEEVIYQYTDIFSKEDKEAASLIDNLKVYLDTPNYKNTVADRVGISVEEWKTCLYAMVFGADPSNMHKNTTLGNIKFTNLLFNPDTFNIEVFEEEIAFLWKPISLWMRYVQRYAKDSILPPSKVAEIQRNLIDDPRAKDLDIKNTFLFNGVNYVHKENSIINNPKQLSSFYLQGMESAFIFHLCTLLPNTDLYNEFDGVVSREPIEEDVLEEARKLSGHKNAVVRIKPFIFVGEP